MRVEPYSRPRGVLSARQRANSATFKGRFSLATNGKKSLLAHRDNLLDARFLWTNKQNVNDNIAIQAQKFYKENTSDSLNWASFSADRIVHKIKDLFFTINYAQPGEAARMMIKKDGSKFIFDPELAENMGHRNLSTQKDSNGIYSAAEELLTPQNHTGIVFEPFHDGIKVHTKGAEDVLTILDNIDPIKKATGLEWAQNIYVEGGDQLALGWKGGLYHEMEPQTELTRDKVRNLNAYYGTIGDNQYPRYLQVNIERGKELCEYLKHNPTNFRNDEYFQYSGVAGMGGGFAKGYKKMPLAFFKPDLFSVAPW